MSSSLLKALTIPDIKKKVFITFLLLAFYRLLTHIPLPIIDSTGLKELFQSNGFFNLLNIFTGGGLSNMSIIAVGLGPYISASIFIQVLTMLVPSLEEMAKEGKYGKQKINQYTMLLTFPMALAQSFAIFSLISKQGSTQIFSSLDIWSTVLAVVIMTAGTYLLMFLGQMITEFGVGQGVSVLIFAGIIASLPASATGFIATIDGEQIFNLLVFLAVSAVVIFSVVYITQGFKKVEVQYSGRARNGQPVSGGRSFIPIKVNQAGVIPIIFAISLVVVPNFLAVYLQRLPNAMLANIGTWLAINFNTNSILYTVTYFLLVFGFTYLYTSIAFNPEKISEDIRKGGGFIPGIRPGSATITYLRYVINRLTFAGALFLGFIAILPSIVQGVTGITSLAVGGTGLLIVVSVILETVKQVEAQVISREYEDINS